MIKVNSSTHKPLVEKTISIAISLSWLIPVANRKKDKYQHSKADFGYSRGRYDIKFFKNN